MAIPNHKVWDARRSVIALKDEVDDENQVLQDELDDILHRLCLVGQAIDNGPQEGIKRGNPELPIWTPTEQVVVCSNCEEEFSPKDRTSCPHCNHDPNGNQVCTFDEPWQGECGEETVSLDPPRCEDHDGKTCSYCDNPAVRGCPSAGSLVCGRPLCEDHDCREHLP